MSIEKELEEEIKRLNEEHKTKSKQFRWEEVGCSPYIFVSINDEKLEPIPFLERSVNYLLENSKDPNQLQSR